MYISLFFNKSETNSSMKKIFSAICLTVAVCTLFFLSCNKDKQFTTQETSLISNAEKWYAKSVNKAGSTKFSIQPNWEQALFLKSSSGEQLIVVPANKENRTNNPKFGMATAFVFKVNSNTIVSGNIVQAIGEANYIEAQSFNILSKYQDNSIPGFKDGSIITYDINHNYIAGRSYIDGQISQMAVELVAGRISPETQNIMQTKSVSGKMMRDKLGDNSKIETLAQKSTKLRIASTYSTAGEGDGGGSGGGGGGGGTTSTYNSHAEVGNCIDWYSVTYDYVSGYIYRTVYLYTACEPPPNGGSVGSPSATQTRRVIDSLNNPCAKAVLDSALKMQNVISGIMRSVFNDDSTPNDLTFAEKNLTNMDGWFEGDGFRTSTGEWAIKGTVYLDDSLLKYGTKELIFATMLHETLHAYLGLEYKRLGATSFQAKYPDIGIYVENVPNNPLANYYKFRTNNMHGSMASNYRNELKAAILQFNPNLPLDVADALSVNGFFYENDFPNGAMLLCQRERQTYTNQYSGTKCPD